MRPDSENRRHPRSPASDTQAALLIDGSTAKLVDFSSGGLRVELPQALTVGFTVQVSGEIEGSAKRLAVGGRYQHLAPAGTYPLGHNIAAAATRLAQDLTD